jgi:hypothetical protein
MLRLQFVEDGHHAQRTGDDHTTSRSDAVQDERELLLEPIVGL